MPYTSVSLIAPTDNCEGGLGESGGGSTGGDTGSIGLGGGSIGGGGTTPIYPSSSFTQAGCCFVADFNLACQSYTEVCGLWASQRLQYSFNADFYRSKVSYRTTPGTHSCDCIKVQTERIELDRTDKIYWVGRYKLVGLRVHVGKTNVTCASGSVGCKFYVAVSYIFETCDYALSWAGGVSFYPEFTRIKTCTGVYRNGTCSFTSTTTESSSVNNCTDVLNQDPWQSCSSTQQKIISRIKLFDTMPTGQISIANADLPPVGCCGGQTGCTITGNPCGLYLVSNCVPNLPQYDGPEMDYFCQTYLSIGPPPYPDNCNITIGCPMVLSKTARQGACEGYTLDAETGCYKRDYLETTEDPGFDRIVCGYCDDPEGRIYYDAIGVANECGAGLCLTGQCCLSPADPTIQTVCKDFNDGDYCRIDVSNFACTIGTLQKFTTGAFCYNLPTVTIEMV